MLQSPDDENKIMALHIIENSDTESNLAFILLLIKELRPDTETKGSLWKMYIPKTLAFINKIYALPHTKLLSYSIIAKILALYKAKLPQYQLLFDMYSESMVRGINKASGDELIQKIEIIIKMKENEKSA